MTAPGPVLLTLPEAADRWKCGKKKFRRLVREGLAPPPFIPGRPNLWSSTDLDNALAKPVETAAPSMTDEELWLERIRHGQADLAVR